MKSVLLGIGIVVALVVLIVASFVLRLGCGVAERTLAPDNAIYNYEFFKQAYQSILATDAKILTARQALDDFERAAGPRNGWNMRDSEEHDRLTVNLTGLRNVRAEMVATYNARAAMVNRAIFRGDAPERVE